VSPHEPVRWGILGTGRITERFLAGARLTKEADVVAVGSRHRARADAFAQEHGVARGHGSYEALLADRDVEAVYIALPNGLHHAWTMAALRAGKHVLCEKPYSRHPSEVVDAFDLAEASHLVLSEAFMWRHHSQARRIVKLLPELGKLETVRATFSFIPAEASDVRLQSDLEGGSLMDVGCYCVSGARLLAGEEPTRAIGSATTGAGGIDVKFSGILEFPSGLTAEISSGFMTDGRVLEAVGSTGSVALLDPWNARPAVMVRDGVRTEFEPEDSYRLEIDDLGSAVRGKTAPLLGRADALGQARAIEALYRAAATGTAIDL
jgi:D-xylose 1-dehydrogenase (NADP+, D-xylono-1,5-lactone-forming)